MHKNTDTRPTPPPNTPPNILHPHIQILILPTNRHNIITLLPLPHNPRIRHLRLRKRRTQRRILDPQLINKRTTLLPPTVRLVGTRERTIQQRAPLLELADLPKKTCGKDEMNLSAKGATATEKGKGGKKSY